jgi:glycosyltransferase involved in cell wall biosynthesis
MKICYLADAGSIHTQRWVKHFADKGHHVDLISYRPFGDNNISGVNLRLITFVKLPMRIFSSWVSFVLTSIRVRKLIKELKPDILHAHYIIDYGLLGALSGFHPLIFTAWGSDVMVAPKKSKLIRLAVKFALTKADVVLTTSQYLKGYLWSQFNLPNSKITALPWGVDLKVFGKGYDAEARRLRASLGINDSSFAILSPRHLKEHYGIENMVQTMPYVLAKYTRVTLILLKGAAEDKRFEIKVGKLIEQLEMGRNVKLIRRHLSAHEMAVLYNVCDALISIPRSDQFASSIQEGMACGTIPIVGNLEVYKQYLTDGENALFVDPNNPKDIADKVIYCIEHPELKQRFYAINRKIIEENEDWAKNAAKLEELYYSLLQGGSGF